MALGHNPSIVRSGLVFCVDAANPKSRLGSNLLTELTSVSNFPANQNVTVTRLSRGEILAVTNQNTSSPGVWPIGGTISVSANTQYTLRVNGTVVSGSAPFLYVNGTTTGDVVWTGNPLTTSGGYVENTFNTGSNTSVRVGVLWNSPTLGSTFTISDIGLFRTDRWYDLSGNAYNGTLTNGPAFSSTNNGYFTFDGTNDYVSYSSTAVGVSVGSTISELTINTWVYWNSFPTNTIDEIVSWWATGSQTYSDGFLGTSCTSNGGGTNANPMIRFGDGWANTGASFTAATDVNKWWCITAVKTASNAYVYKNSDLAATKGSALDWGFNDNLAIGRQHAAGEYLNGRIGVIQFYNRALTAVEIAQNFNAVRDRYGI